MALKLQFVPEPNDYNASKHQQGRHHRGYDRLHYVPDYDSNRNLLQQGGLNEPRYLQFMPPPGDHDQRGGPKVPSRGAKKRRYRKSNPHYYEGIKEPNLRKRYQKTWLRLMARMQQVSGWDNWLKIRQPFFFFFF